MNSNSRGLSIRDIESYLNLEVHVLPYPTKKDIRFANGFCVYHSGRDYWVITGKFPLNIADEISKKAIDLSIRVNGGRCDDAITDFINHKKLDDYVSNYIQSKDKMGLSDFVCKCESIKEEVLKNDYENCYISYYHIDTLDGLKYVLDIIRSNNIYTKWFE